MAHCNEKYLNLQSACLFDEINEKQNAYKESHPDADIISLDIEDGTQPLAPSAAEAMKKAVDEMSRGGTFPGCGPEQGYLFLREAIAKNDLRSFPSTLTHNRYLSFHFMAPALKVALMPIRSN